MTTDKRINKLRCAMLEAKAALSNGLQQDAANGPSAEPQSLLNMSQYFGVEDAKGLAMVNEEFLKQYWSPNRSIHIGNLERALVEMRQQMDYVKETNGHIGRERNDLQQQLAASEASRKKLETKLQYAEDAAAKGELARQTAAGMEMEINELKESRKELERALKQTFGEYLNEDYADVSDGRAVGEFTAADLRRAVKALAKPSPQQ